MKMTIVHCKMTNAMSKMKVRLAICGPVLISLGDVQSENFQICIHLLGNLACMFQQLTHPNLAPFSKALKWKPTTVSEMKTSLVYWWSWMGLSRNLQFHFTDLYIDLLFHTSVFGAIIPRNQIQLNNTTKPISVTAAFLSPQWQPASAKVWRR